jgi:hypothetical protein
MMRINWLVLPMLLAAAPAGAQVVSGVVEGYGGGTVPYASVAVTDRDGMVVASTTTDRGGRFTLHLETGGQYRLRVSEEEHMGMSVAFRVDDNGTYTRRVRLHPRFAHGHRGMGGAGRDERAAARGSNGPGGGGGGGGRRTPAGSDN